MKRSYLIFLVIAMVVFSVGAWLMSAGASMGSVDLLQFVVIGLLVLFALFIGYTRLKSERRGEPAEDEMSKQIMTKASSVSYFISLYVWLALMYISDKKVYDNEVLFGSGILAMGVIFALSWLVIWWRGVRNG